MRGSSEGRWQGGTRRRGRNKGGEGSKNGRRDRKSLF